jgi:hypothetical protein
MPRSDSGYGKPRLGPAWLASVSAIQCYRVLPGVDYADLIAGSGQACPLAEALPPPLPAPTTSPGMPQPSAITTRPMTFELTKN